MNYLYARLMKLYVSFTLKRTMRKLFKFRTQMLAYDIVDVAFTKRSGDLAMHSVLTMMDAFEKSMDALTESVRARRE